MTSETDGNVPLQQLQGKLDGINDRFKDMLLRHKEELTVLQDAERSAVEDYCKQVAKFQIGDRVLRKKEPSSEQWIQCFIAARIVNKDSWAIEYYVCAPKRDGSPSRVISSYPYPEADFKPYGMKEI
jgi:hypothetical protein